MAEWLGEGLQNLLRRFDSVWYLKKNTDSKELVFFIFTKSKLPLNLYSYSKAYNILWFQVFAVETVDYCQIVCIRLEIN